jgi:L-ascorbate metabolism protein UlaG (beta-lactamase superfamily)
VLVELGGTRLITDPVLRRRVGPLLRQGAAPRPEVARDLDAVLLSHLHHDHADLPSLRRLDRRVAAIVGPGAGRFLSKLGFSQVTELAPGESISVAGTEITAVEADHRSGRLLERDSQAVGFRIAGGGRQVYFAGDTDLFDGMREIGPGIDLALLPIWGWGPSIGAGHLDPERAARAAGLISPRIAVPIHWGTLYPAGLARLRPAPLREPPLRFAACLRELAPQVEGVVLEPGEAVSLA